MIIKQASSGGDGGGKKNDYTLDFLNLAINQQIIYFIVTFIRSGCAVRMLYLPAESNRAIDPWNGTPPPRWQG
jgi:hypothetical protein